MPTIYARDPRQLRMAQGQRSPVASSSKTCAAANALASDPSSAGARFHRPSPTSRQARFETCQGLREVFLREPTASTLSRPRSTSILLTSRHAHEMGPHADAAKTEEECSMNVARPPAEWPSKPHLKVRCSIDVSKTTAPGNAAAIFGETEAASPGPTCVTTRCAGLTRFSMMAFVRAGPRSY